MKKYSSKLLILVVLSSLYSGCATKGYINAQLEPVTDRIGKLEAKSAEMAPLPERIGKAETKLTAIESRIGNVEKSQINPGDVDEVRKTAQEARRLAEEAAKAAQEAPLKAEAAARRAEDAVAKVENQLSQLEDAVKRAETAADKSRKIFELQQKK